MVQLEVAQWMLSLKPDIDISSHNECAFRSACEKGHLEVAKWLLSLKPDIDISANEEYAFKFACKNGHLEVAKWLCTLNETYYIEIDISGRINTYRYNIKIKYNSIIEIEEMKECCVCYETATLKTSCQHYGCEQCFQQLYNKCPYCRQDINEYYKIKFLENKFLENKFLENKFLEKT